MEKLLGKFNIFNSTCIITLQF